MGEKWKEGERDPETERRGETDTNRNRQREPTTTAMLTEGSGDDGGDVPTGVQRRQDFRHSTDVSSWKAGLLHSWPSASIGHDGSMSIHTSSVD